MKKPQFTEGEGILEAIWVERKRQEPMDSLDRYCSDSYPGQDQTLQAYGGNLSWITLFDETPLGRWSVWRNAQ